jgi:phosphatidylglycerophosphate synthase
VVAIILFWGTLITTLWSAADYILVATRSIQQKQNSA